MPQRPIPVIHHEPAFDLDGGQREAISELVAEGFRGPVEGYACNLSPRDLIAASRHGEIGGRLGARVTISILEGGEESIVALAAPQARAFAALLLNIADEVDGDTPLTFTPPPAGYYIADDASGDPTIWRERPEHPHGDEAVASYSTDLKDGRAWDDLFATLPRREVVEGEIVEEDGDA